MVSSSSFHGTSSVRCTRLLRSSSSRLDDINTGPATFDSVMDEACPAWCICAPRGAVNIRGGRVNICRTAPTGAPIAAVRALRP